MFGIYAGDLRCGILCVMGKIIARAAAAAIAAAVSRCAAGEAVCALETVDVDTGARVVVKTFDHKVEAPNWTPDGKHLIFNSGGRLWRVPVGGGEVEPVDTGFCTRCNNDHVLSADGKSIAVSHDEKGSRIFVVRLDGPAEPKPITQKGSCYLHGWSPDGKWFAYCAMRDADPRGDVYAISADGGEEVRLTTAEGLDDGPEYSPDGRSIWFCSVRSGLMQVWRMNADGTEQTQMTDERERNCWFPHVSPDGKRVVYLAYRKGDLKPSEHLAGKHVELRVMPASGGEGRTFAKLFGGQGTINVNSWSPDSTKVAFVSYADKEAAKRADGRPDFPAYQPVGSDTGVNDLATGFFRLSQHGDGRWWVIDPCGRGIVLLGVDHVTYHGHWCDTTKKFHHLEEMKKRFPNEEDWRVDTLGRLRKWGFNMLGAGSSDDLHHRGLVHTTFLSMGDTWAYDKDESHWICPNEGRPCSAFPNVFHPDWRKHCDEIAARLCAPNKDDPWLFGYFIDNELAWWGRSSEWGTSGTGLFDEAMKRPDGHPAKEAARRFASLAGAKDGERVPDEAKLAFLRRAAELYFEGACAAIRAADPNHLVLGARFAGVSGANPVVWEEAGRRCDLVTFNCYPWADLDRNIVLNDAWKRAGPVGEVFARVYSIEKKPMLVTEWSFPALDSGLPCTNGAGQRFRTQSERTAASELFAKTILSMPFLIGYDYFMWVDEPALGISKAFPENTNYGLINEKGDPYPEITSMFERLHGDAGKWRFAAPPQQREAKKTPVLAHDAIAAESKPSSTWTKSDGKSYRMGNSDGLVLEGSVGGGKLFDEVSIGSARFGSLNVMMAFPVGDRIAWCRARRVESFEDKGSGKALVTLYGESDGFEYRAEVEVTVIPGQTKYVADIRRVVNAGKKPITLKLAFFCQDPGPLEDAVAAEEIQSLWNAPARATWVAKDGRFHGAYSRSPLARNFWYWRDENGTHPDAFFEPGPSDAGGSLELAPGAAWEPGGAAYIVGYAGFNISLWQDTISR